MNSSEKKYAISAIERLRVAIDGEGIRTLIVTSGCPLRCRYCINSFTWEPSHEKMMTAKDIYDRIRIDRPYMLATCGGLTIGGGEPLMQPDLFLELRQLCEPEMTLYAETSLNVPLDNIILAQKCIDKFIVDIKTLDPVIYQDYTGKNMGGLLEHLKYLIAEKGSDAVDVRIPIIPSYTNAQNQQRDAQVLRNLGVKNIEFFRYKA